MAETIGEQNRERAFKAWWDQGEWEAPNEFTLAGDAFEAGWREALAAAAPAPPAEPVCEDCDTSAKCHGIGNCPAPPPQDVRGAERCGVIGYPEQEKRVCELPVGHKDDYHRQGSVRWIGAFIPPTNFIAVTDAERKAYEKETAALGPPRGGGSSDLAEPISPSVVKETVPPDQCFNCGSCGETQFVRVPLCADCFDEMNEVA